EVASINGRRAVSSLESSLETVFTGSRAYVAIVSSKTINDDKLKQEVILQTTNIMFETPDDVTSNSSSLVASKNKAVDITVMIPDKSTNILSEVYTLGRTGTVLVKTANPATGRIIIEVQGIDFTNSPAKIQVTYRDENDKLRTTSCYLTIKTPTIMLAGTTVYGHYYTTSGVEVKTKPDGSTYSQLKVDARHMNITGAQGTMEIPAGTVFKSVKWITETDSAGEFVDACYEPSYYVLTGTNGTIYRTYTFTESNNIVGRVNLDTSDEQPNGKNQLGADVIGLSDKAFVLDDAKSTTVYPAIWGADFSHIYGYSAYHTFANYKDQVTWYTQSDYNTGVGQPGYYSNKANYGYYYNGYGTNFDYYTQNSKKISYILTELPYALRVGGFMNAAGDYDGGINRVWERPINFRADGSYTSQNEQHEEASRFDAYYYKKTGENLSRCAFVELSKNKTWGGTNWIYDDEYLNEIPTYYVKYGTQSAGQWGDEAWAQLRIKAMTTISPTFLYEQKDNDDDGLSSFRFVHNRGANQSKINVTDAVFLPATTSGGTGTMFYTGTVAAYAAINQIDNIYTDENYAATMRNNGEDNRGGQTTYYVMGNAEGTNTSIYKYSSSALGRQDGNQTVYQNKSTIQGTGVIANSDESREFFVTRNSGGNSQQLFSDVLFTMGFTSNRELVYSKIVYGITGGALKEAYKSYEPFYFLSHYDDVTDTHVPNLYMNDYASTKTPTVGDNGYGGNITGGYFNVIDNDYYNVWFPGEMYNLTKVATKEGVTVAVGYAVSGSTYTWINPDQPTNASTALGGIHNDGVLAGIVLGQDNSFTNLLYFKDDENFDNYSLADGSLSSFTGSKSYRNLLAGGDSSWNYGTHQRNSVQFTSVDISIESVVRENSEVASYYAYYADSKGRLYKSLIATKTTLKNQATKSVPQMVTHVSDKHEPSAAPSYMQEIMINGYRLNHYFSKITSVSCEGDYIIVGGHSADGNFNIVVGKIQQADDQLSNTVTWKIVKISGAGDYKTEDAMILDGYVYLAGTSTGNYGWVYAASLDEINRTANNSELYFDGNRFVGDIKDKIYTIDGHSAS
ncbi:MAG: hypothetical protein IKC01_08850, partial [Clostridia bacterium]|nr:hypothetical protein [Clostridia bacterium]